MLRASHRRGLTRLEVVVAACASLTVIGLLLPAIQRARAGSKTSACQNNLRYLAIGTLNYHDTFDMFPPGMDDQYVGELVRILP
jgi:hypothetical protein